MDLGSALIAMVSAVVVAGIGYATTKLTSSTQKKTAEVEARGPEWHEEQEPEARIWRGPSMGM